MSKGTVIPHSEELKRALRWISGSLEKAQEKNDLARLISEAGARFNLSPAEQDTLHRMMSVGKNSEPAEQ
ncbi:MAG: hypothetical protein GXP49_09170 [Deltaproteobacteria bacterium]|nr:hypothetical protein [Deltaproteobacteria bacterium]